MSEKIVIEIASFQPEFTLDHLIISAGGIASLQGWTRSADRSTFPAVQLSIDGEKLEPVEKIEAGWQEGLNQFKEISRKYHLYE